jgi:hypothetical protein
MTLDEGRTMISKTLHLDDRVDSYRSFLDYDWVKAIEKQTHGTILDEPLMSLIFSWKATANAFTMPFLMMHFLRNFEVGHCRGQDSASEQALKVLADHLPERMAKRHKWSPTKKRQISEAIAELFAEVDVAKHTMPTLDVDKLFNAFLYGDGGSEMQLGVFGMTQTCYGTTFHAYEHFISRCVGLAKNKPHFKADGAQALVADVRKEFGDEVADFCLVDEQIEIARLARNALAHNGGKMNEKLKKKDHGFFVVDDVLHVVAADNHRLFNILKVRVSKLVEKALTMPQFKA